MKHSVAPLRPSHSHPVPLPWNPCHHHQVPLPVYWDLVARSATRSPPKPLVVAEPHHRPNDNTHRAQGDGWGGSPLRCSFPTGTFTHPSHPPAMTQGTAWPNQDRNPPEHPQTPPADLISVPDGSPTEISGRPKPPTWQPPTAPSKGPGPILSNFDLHLTLSILFFYYCNSMHTGKTDLQCLVWSLVHHLCSSVWVQLQKHHG